MISVYNRKNELMQLLHVFINSFPPTNDAYEGKIFSRRNRVFPSWEEQGVGKQG